LGASTLSLLSTTVHEKVYLTLKRAIMCGRFRPGEFLVSRSLAVELGTSEMPVREAIKRLSTEGAVEPTALRKFRIPELDREKLKGVFAARLILEGAAIERASELRTETDLARILEIHEQIRAEQNLQTQRKKQNGTTSLHYMELNQKFHFTIYEIAGIPALIPLIESLWLQYMPAVAQHSDILLDRLSVAEVAEFNQEENENHERIYQAILEQDASKARQALVHDIAPIEELIEIADEAGVIPVNPRLLRDYLQKY
jgi:DNA-binding GntR family transcriptional regulator